MTTLTEFHLFPNLPTELCLKIWSAAILQYPARSVLVRCQKGISEYPSASANRRYAKSFEAGLVPHEAGTPPPEASIIPPFLHACVESRYHAMTTYTPLFKTKHSPIYTYIDLTRETVSMTDSDLAYLGHAELQGIQRMIIDVRDCAYFAHYNMDTVVKMGRLMELDIMMEDGMLYGRGRGGTFSQMLNEDFEDARREHPGWVCPRVRMLRRWVGDTLSEIEGGALIPGWKEGDPMPWEFEEPAEEE